MSGKRFLKTLENLSRVIMNECEIVRTRVKWWLEILINTFQAASLSCSSFQDDVSLKESAISGCDKHTLTISCSFSEVSAGE